MLIKTDHTGPFLAHVVLAALCASFLIVSCSGDKSTGPTTTLNWVGTEVLYRPVEGKHDLSLLFILHAQCGACQQLKQETLTDSDVGAILNESFNIAQIDMAVDTPVVYFDSTVSSKYLGRTVYAITAYPTIVALDRDGAEIGRIVGFKEPDAFISDLEAIRDLPPRFGR